MEIKSPLNLTTIRIKDTRKYERKRIKDTREKRKRIKDTRNKRKTL